MSDVTKKFSELKKMRERTFQGAQIRGTRIATLYCFLKETNPSDPTLNLDDLGDSVKNFVKQWGEIDVVQPSRYRGLAKTLVMHYDILRPKGIDGEELREGQLEEYIESRKTWDNIILELNEKYRDDREEIQNWCYSTWEKVLKEMRKEEEAEEEKALTKEKEPPFHDTAVDMWKDEKRNMEYNIVAHPTIGPGDIDWKYVMPEPMKEEISKNYGLDGVAEINLPVVGKQYSTLLVIDQGNIEKDVVKISVLAQIAEVLEIDIIVRDENQEGLIQELTQNILGENLKRKISISLFDEFEEEVQRNL